MKKNSLLRGWAAATLALCALNAPAAMTIWINEATPEGAAEGTTTPIVTYDAGIAGIGSVVSSWERAQGNFTVAPVHGDVLSADVNIAWTEPGGGTQQSDWLHVQWSQNLQTGLIDGQWQFQSEPTVPLSPVDFWRAETPGWMWLTPADVASDGHFLPGGLSFAVESVPVPEPSTYVAGIGALLVMAGTFLRRKRK